MEVAFIQFNHKNSYTDLGMKILDKVIIPFPKRKVEVNDVPGADGDYYIYTDAYEDITVPVNFEILDQEHVKSKYRVIKRWLTEIHDNNIVFSDDYEYLYKVKNVVIGNDFETKFGLYGVVDVNFICEPYSYNISGSRETPLKNRLLNPGIKAKPIYRIKGEGLLTLIVNSNPIIINVGQEVIVDTELQLVLRQGDIENVRKKGKWEHLELPPGQNTFSWIGNFEIKIIPNWRTY